MTKEILTQDKLMELLNYDSESGNFIWNSSGKGRRSDLKAGCPAVDRSGKTYKRICIFGVTHKAHRLAWLYVYGEFPENDIDHINGNSIDNRISNLRKVTKKGNARNRRLINTNTSGACGVSRIGDKWRVQIKINGITQHIGTFDNFDGAVLARKQFEIANGFHSNHGQQREL